MNERQPEAVTRRPDDGIIRSWDDIPQDFASESEEARWWAAHTFSEEMAATGISVTPEMRAALGFPPARES